MNIVLEISFYIINLVVFYVLLIPRIGSQIAEKCTEHRGCRDTVRGTWHGLKVDLADGQWREFRNVLPLLGGAALLITILHHIFRHWKVQKTFPIRSSHFHLIAGLIVLIVQHGWHSFVVLCIIITSFIFGRILTKSRYSVVLIWIFACSVIALKESYRIQWYPGFEVCI